MLHSRVKQQAASCSPIKSLTILYLHILTRVSVQRDTRVSRYYVIQIIDSCSSSVAIYGADAADMMPPLSHIPPARRHQRLVVGSSAYNGILIASAHSYYISLIAIYLHAAANLHCWCCCCCLLHTRRIVDTRPCPYYVYHHHAMAAPTYLLVYSHHGF